ncbi:MAG TPA: hypothetical protein VF662_01360 [Allosphingosinicella sp.]|jgi:hypothetical protein
MSELLPLHDDCRRCGGQQAAPPSGFGEHAWMLCSACREPVTTWGEYKKTALEAAAKQLRTAYGRRYRG